MSQPQKNIETSNRFAVLLVVAIGILAMLPAYYWGIPAGADLNNHFGFVVPFYDEISRGNYVPGWLAESNNGFGDARFRFYPPVLYYLLSAARWVTGDWYFATLIVFTFFSIIGALGVYCWARQGLSVQTSLLAALLFAFVPYHLTQFYQASLLAEFAATALLPFAFMFVERLTANKSSDLCDSLFNIAGLGISFALLVTTHLPLTVIGSLSLGVFALVSTDWRANKKAIIFASLGVALGLVLSSWFWVKMLSELSWIQGGSAVSSVYYDYHNNFLFSPFSAPNRNTWFGGFVAVLTVGIFLPSLIVLRRLFSRRQGDDSYGKYRSGDAHTSKRRLRAALIVALLSFLMTTDLSRPVWAIIPKLESVQFPYRWLTIMSVVICPITAFSMQIWRDRIRQKDVRALHLPIFLAFAVALVVTGRELIVYSDYLARDEFRTRLEEIHGGRSFNEWLPPGAGELKDLQPRSGQVDAGSREIISTNWQTHKRRFMLAEGAETQIRLRSYYYPLWHATILGTGQPAATSQAPDGTLLVAVPPESCEIEVAFTEPPRTAISFVVSALGWIFGFVLLLFEVLKVKALRN